MVNGSFTKLFSSITASTIWCEPDHVRIVWITMLAMADRHGEVQASIPGLAAIARVQVDQCRQAIGLFLKPDPDSRTKAHEGRRVEEIDGGWRLLNYAHYREIRDAETLKEAKRKWWQENRGVPLEQKLEKLEKLDQTRPKQKQKQKQINSKTLGTRFALSVQPEDWKTFCLQERPDLNPESVFNEFTDYWKAVPGSRGVKLDWLATWRNWVRRQARARSPALSEEFSMALMVKCRALGIETKGRTADELKALLIEKERAEENRAFMEKAERDKAARAPMPEKLKIALGMRK